MSECRVPSWNNNNNNNNNNNLSQQIRQVEAGEEERNRSSSSSHVHHHHHRQTHRPPYYVVPISNYEVAELTWENGQLAMHGLTGAGILQPPASKPPPTPTFGDTLESIVHQATAGAPPININPISAATASGGGVEKRASFVKKRMRSSESDQSGRHNISSSRIRSSFNDDQQMVVGGGGGGGAGATAAERSACASESATFCREKDAGTTTMMTWTSFESPPGTGSFKTHNNKTTDDDSACHDASENCRDQEMETKGESVRSQSARRSRAAFIHNQSERRRRDRINEKMKALQKLVPNASKTDKASMLDEVIVYLKQLQNEVQMMSRNMALPQMMMMMNPLAMQQQLQMSLLARMGMGMGVGLGMGMGMLDSNTLVRSTTSPISSGLISTTPMPSSFLPSHFAMPTAPHPSQPKSSATNPAPPPFADPYTSFLAQQAMNMDIYKMAALYRQHQQANQATQATSNSSQPNFIQRE